MTTTPTDATLTQVAGAIRARHRFVVVSHARPDGDAIGSQVAMALALRALGIVAISTSAQHVEQQLASVADEIDRVEPGLVTRTELEFLA